MNITPDDLAKVRAKLPVSKSTLAANQSKTAAQINLPQCGQVVCVPQFRNMWDHEPPAAPAVPAAPAKRIRQGEPKLRQWEHEWKERLENSGEWMHIKGQSIRLRLANGAWYRGDVSAVPCGGEQYQYHRNLLNIFEVKGGAKMKGTVKGILAVKCAASLYPEIRFWLVWKVRGGWQRQEVIP